MIKQIQLRGISHRPSDKLTQDGGLEECIDLRLENQELGPAKDAVNVTDELAPGLSTSGIDVMYIHKGNGYANYIGTKEVSEGNVRVTYLAAYVHDPDNQNANASGWVCKLIHSFPSEIDSITSVGNMLMVAASGEERTYYALFKDSNYKYLASNIPRPTVLFNEDLTATSAEVVILDCHEVALDCVNETGASLSPGLFWDYILSKRYSNDEKGLRASEFFDKVKDTIWASINKERTIKRGEGKFAAPVLARYAVRLFDGSYIYVSEPYILSSGNHSHIKPLVCNVGTSNSRAKFVMDVGVQDVFSVGVSVSFNNATLSDWKEIISSVDVFLSNDILVPKINAEPASDVLLTSRMEVTDITFLNDDIEVKFDGEGESTAKAFEERYTDAANFYLADRYDINNLPTNAPLLPADQDELVTRQRLSEGYSQEFAPFGEIGSYNNRLVSGSQKVTLPPGGYFQASVPSSHISPAAYAVFYHVRDSYGNERIVRGAQASVYPENIRAYLAYPDPNCFQADLYVGSTDSETGVTTYTTKVILPMKEHPRLNCSYGFWGLDERLDTPVSGDGRSSETAGELPTENPWYLQYDRLMLSEMDNPFVYPLGQRQRFSDRIIGVVPATIALSTGQFGQFPLYVFTESGIWTISLDDEGKMAASHPVSRDVAKEGTIVQLDQAIAFVSDQGVMILQGSQVSCLSPFMEGPQYTIKDVAPAGGALRTALAADGYGSLLGLSLDTTSFKDFINGCKPLYDYENKRILLFNQNVAYAYECDLETQTWRKHTIPERFVRNLNGYPKAYSYLEQGAIYEWSVRQNFNSVNPSSRKGWVLTRPFDLDAPDVRKAIKSIRIRGVYNHSDVKYILLGSMNGIQWQRLTSLRGGSYKSFRLLILTNFTPGEKLSWVDVDYDLRFDNKLR